MPILVHRHIKISPACQGLSGIFYSILTMLPTNLSTAIIRVKKYLAKNATILKSGGYWSGRNSGYCDYTSADSYNSDRQTSMTQMNIAVTPPETDAEPFSQMVIGKRSRKPHQ